MKSFKMEVSKKVDGAYEKQGEVEVFFPLLSDLGLSIDPASFDDDGFPVYSDDKVQYAFDGVLAAVKAQARNKLVSGTATLKAGLTIATTVEELLESGGGNRGEALAINREFLAAFKGWLPSTGKSAAVQSLALTYAKNKEALQLADSDRKEKFGKYLTDFASSLDAAQAARFSRPLLTLQDAIEVEVEGF